MAGEVGKVSLARAGGLDEFVKKAREWGCSVNVGFLDPEIAQIAAWNEYGVSWASRAKEKDDGKSSKKAKKKMITIPARPFMQQTIDHNKKSWSKTLKAIVDKMGDPTKLEKADIENAMGILGTVIVGQIKDTIAAGDFVENAKSTIARKGKNTPLQDTGKMMQSIDYEVKSK
ncbi:MAG: neck protein [Caudoviricetes sp.]|nr:MAG: neck protein [Caudoviricetes sp.]